MIDWNNQKLKVNFSQVVQFTVNFRRRCFFRWFCPFSLNWLISWFSIKFGSFFSLKKGLAAFFVVYWQKDFSSFSWKKNGVWKLKRRICQKKKKKKNRIAKFFYLWLMPCECQRIFGTIVSIVCLKKTPIVYSLFNIYTEYNCCCFFYVLKIKWFWNWKLNLRWVFLFQ